MVTGESGNYLIVCWPVAIDVACITVSRPGGELGNVNAVEHYQGHSSPPDWECARLPLTFDRLLGEFHPPAGGWPGGGSGRWDAVLVGWVPRAAAAAARSSADVGAGASRLRGQPPRFAGRGAGLLRRLRPPGQRHRHGGT